MWFWSVSWSTNCPGYFSLFLVDQKEICSVSGNFWSVSELFLVRLWIFGILKINFGVPKRNLVNQKNQSLTKNSLRLNKFFFGRPKKGRNRLDNWSTKRLTKTTWTGLLSHDSKLFECKLTFFVIIEIFSTYFCNIFSVVRMLIALGGYKRTPFDKVEFNGLWHPWLIIL